MEHKLQNMMRAKGLPIDPHEIPSDDSAEPDENPPLDLPTDVGPRPTNDWIESEVAFDNYCPDHPEHVNQNTIRKNG